VLSVSDTGIGMTPEVQERMFEPFFTTKSSGKGTGLGLSTVYGIVKQSGGFLICDSQPGHGTTFSIYLPRVQETVAPEKPVNPDWLLHGKETILLVEDEEALRESIRHFLSGLGYTVLTASSGAQALAIARRLSQPIALMITDVIMPKMSGRELSQEVATIRPELKIIFMSGYSDDAELRQGGRAQGTAFLQKPFSLSALARKLREMLS
jgi:two-component system cell cycle sensor histidine kinase/response regulator CckA